MLALGVTDKSLGDASDIISDSSGVGTANSDTTNCSISMPGSTVVCIESYSPKDKGHIAIREGELIEGKLSQRIHNVSYSSVEYLKYQSENEALDRRNGKRPKKLVVNILSKY